MSMIKNVKNINTESIENVNNTESIENVEDINDINDNIESIDVENIDDIEKEKENKTMSTNMNANMNEIKNENNMENDVKKENEKMSTTANMNNSMNMNMNDDVSETEFVRVYEFISSLNLISVQNNRTLSLTNNFDSARFQSIIKEIDKSFHIQKSTEKIDYAFISDADADTENNQYVIHWTCYGHPNRDDSTVDDARNFILNGLMKLVPQFMSKPIYSFLIDPEAEAGETEKIQGNIVCTKEDIYINFGMTLVYQSSED